MSLLGERLIAVHAALGAAGLPHAFGGAIALAYCTQEPRGTRDLDVNVFVPPSRADEVLAALPAAVIRTAKALRALERDAQARLWWEETPVDVFLDNLPLHEEAARGVRQVPFEGEMVPVLGCQALIVFKALFDRTRDWADIEDMAAAVPAEVAAARSRLDRLMGADDPRTRRLTELLG